MSEVYTEQEFKVVKGELYRRRVRKTLEKIFSIYNKKRELLLEDIVSKMVSGGNIDTQPKANGYENKLERLVIDHASAEEFVKLIDEIMQELDPTSYDIIELVYIDRTVSNKEIYEEILDMSERWYYKLKAAAEDKMYKKIVKNYPKLKK